MTLLYFDDLDLIFKVLQLLDFDKKSACQHSVF